MKHVALSLVKCALPTVASTALPRSSKMQSNSPWKGSFINAMRKRDACRLGENAFSTRVAKGRA